MIAAGNFAARRGTASAVCRGSGPAPRGLGNRRLRQRHQARRTQRHRPRTRRATRRRPAPALPIALDEVLGPEGVRGATVAGTQVHSLRLPSYVISTEVIFGAESERLSIRYDAGESAAPYIAGTLVAIRAVPNRVGLTRGLDRLLFSET